jgi:predicted dehydrogenase
LRYALVGLGNLGQRRRALLGDRCVATVDPVNPAADFTSPEQLSDDAYDAAVLSVPNEPKRRLIEYFAARGKPVLVDKPVLLADDGPDGFWYTSYNHRFEPTLVALRQRLDEGFLGTLYHGRMLYGNGTVGNVVG